MKSKLIGGKKSFVKYLDEGFSSKMANPTIYYIDDSGFELAPGVYRRSDAVFSKLLYYRATNGRRNLIASDYAEVREDILRALDQKNKTQNL